MKIPKHVLMETAINIIISMIMYVVAALTVFRDQNPFNNGFHGFLVFFIILSFLDMVYKLIKKLMGVKRK